MATLKQLPQVRAQDSPPIDSEQFARNREVGRAILRWLDEDPDPNPEVEEDIKSLLARP